MAFVLGWVFMTLAADIADDYLLAPKLEDAVVHHVAAATSETVENVYWTPVRRKEAGESKGVYTTRDRKCMVGAAAIDTEPKPGDLITDAAAVQWTVLEADLFRLGTIYRCWCRKLEIDGTLGDLCQIQQTMGTFVDSVGSPAPRWATVYADVRCNFKAIDGGQQTEQNQTRVFSKYLVTLGQSLDFADSTYRIVRDGVSYTIGQVLNLGEIASLPQVLVTRDPDNPEGFAT